MEGAGSWEKRKAGLTRHVKVSDNAEDSPSQEVLPRAGDLSF